MYLLTACLLLVYADLPGSAVPIEQLVCQLGSEVFHEREAATRALEALGAPALGALRQAATENDDAEIRHRAARLVDVLDQRLLRKQVEAIENSSLSPEEKTRRLATFLSPGMSMKRIERGLGIAPIHFEDGSVYYPAHNLMIKFDKQGMVASVSTWEARTPGYDHPPAKEF
jgi:hypothetical protein